MIRDVLERDTGILRAIQSGRKSGVVESLIQKVELQQESRSRLHSQARVKTENDNFHSYRELALQMSARKRLSADTDRSQSAVHESADLAQRQIEQMRLRQFGLNTSDNDQQNVRVKGSWGNGQLKTESGLSGTYKALEGGQIEFSLGPIKGYVLPNSTGVAYNPKTGQSYSFNLEYDQTSFKMINVQELKPAGSQSGEPQWSGEIKGRVAHFDGFNLVMGANGKVLLPGRPAMNPDTEEGKIARGEGFLDKNGNLVVAFENGGTYRADYKIEDGKLLIFKYELLG